MIPGCLLSLLFPLPPKLRTFHQESYNSSSRKRGRECRGFWHVAERESTLSVSAQREQQSSQEQRQEEPTLGPEVVLHSRLITDLVLGHTGNHGATVELEVGH